MIVALEASEQHFSIDFTAVLQRVPLLGRQQLLKLGRRFPRLGAVRLVGDDGKALAFSRGQFVHGLRRR
jgi:hypothetical protein